MNARDANVTAMTVSGGLEALAAQWRPYVRGGAVLTGAGVLSFMQALIALADLARLQESELAQFRALAATPMDNPGAGNRGRLQ